ncbi:PrgH/EprH family type III secretion apparatus protein [Chitinasiproducens palmae]|uniref:Type III secretion system protein PrgH-EprH (PrgH) n=1 Tax=Chitinasiproducens palmae TaxID=1770053 RepID=A0A1H2PJ67_9BURK|nr:PrgH/EprH family type III secretion apparatus protein [Chitinasiproducens palmae]SDV46264.1 Type III secretion system protein PrgH-EprH (PrgH) [Chitinasiproducens palmae]
MIDRNIELLFALRILSGTMAGTEVPLERDRYLIVAGPGRPGAPPGPARAAGDAGEAPTSVVAPASMNGREAVAADLLDRALTEANGRTVWLAAQTDVALRIDLSDTALSGRFSVTDIGHDTTACFELQRRVSYAGLSFALKPIDAAWEEAVLLPPDASPDAPADASPDALRDASAALASGLSSACASNASLPDGQAGDVAAGAGADASARHAEAPQPPRRAGRLPLRRRLLSAVAMLCVVGSIAAAAARALPGALAERQTERESQTRMVAPPERARGGALLTAAMPQRLAGVEARRSVHQAAMQAGLKPVAIRLASGAGRVVLLDDGTPSPVRARLAARFKAALAGLAPAVPIPELEYVPANAAIAAARALFVQAGIPMREQRHGNGIRLSPAARLDDATRQSMRAPLQHFRAQWGDTLVRIDFEPLRDPRDGKSHLDGRAGYVLLAPGHWYFPDVLKG